MRFKKITDNDFETLTRSCKTDNEYHQKCEMLKKFIEDYNIVGWNTGYEKPAHYLFRILCRGSKTKRLHWEYSLGWKHYSLFDHAISFKDIDGNVMVHITPYYWIPEHQDTVLAEFEEFLNDTNYEQSKELIKLTTLSTKYDFRTKMNGSCSLLIHNDRLEIEHENN